MMLGVAIGDLLHAERDGAQARAAKLVDAEGRGLLRDAALHGCDAGRVLALRGGENLAHDHFINFAALDLGAGERGGDGGGAKLMGGNCAECAVEGSDCGAGRRDDDDISGHGYLLCNARRAQIKWAAEQSSWLLRHINNLE